MTVRVRAVVTGRVQGVGFRWAAARAAAARGVTGLVRNLPDGRVEAEVEGERADVDAMLNFLRTGPPGAQVAGVDVEHLPPVGGAGFEITG
ncbi:acylphosphatase [Isoptericola hypogeus]|uniref:acylphosphatase n=1 Tax=Isoptericola hypogeus TaxID=300179 RepID=A0ABP4VRU9_9MICO